MALFNEKLKVGSRQKVVEVTTSETNK